jgi:hypothetical protein
MPDLPYGDSGQKGGKVRDFAGGATAFERLDRTLHDLASRRRGAEDRFAVLYKIALGVGAGTVQTDKAQRVDGECGYGVEG